MRTPRGVNDVMVYESSLRAFATLRFALPRFAMLPLDLMGLEHGISVCRQSRHKPANSAFGHLEIVENPKSGS